MSCLFCNCQEPDEVCKECCEPDELEEFEVENGKASS